MEQRHRGRWVTAWAVILLAGQSCGGGDLCTQARGLRQACLGTTWTAQEQQSCEGRLNLCSPEDLERWGNYYTCMERTAECRDGRIHDAYWAGGCRGWLQSRSLSSWCVDSGFLLCAQAKAFRHDCLGNPWTDEEQRQCEENLASCSLRELDLWSQYYHCVAFYGACQGGQIGEVAGFNACHARYLPRLQPECQAALPEQIVIVEEEE